MDFSSHVGLFCWFTFFFFFLTWPHHLACGILVPNLGSNPWTGPALEARSLNHRHPGKSLFCWFLLKTPLLLSFHPHLYTQTHPHRTTTTFMFLFIILSVSLLISQHRIHKSFILTPILQFNFHLSSCPLIQTRAILHLILISPLPGECLSHVCKNRLFIYHLSENKTPSKYSSNMKIQNQLEPTSSLTNICREEHWTLIPSLEKENSQAWHLPSRNSLLL